MCTNCTVGSHGTKLLCPLRLDCPLSAFLSYVRVCKATSRQMLGAMILLIEAYIVHERLLLFFPPDFRL